MFKLILQKELRMRLRAAKRLGKGVPAEVTSWGRVPAVKQTDMGVGTEKWADTVTNV